MKEDIKDRIEKFKNGHAPGTTQKKNPGYYLETYSFY
jgi:hypothetical protein